MSPSFSSQDILSHNVGSLLSPQINWEKISSKEPRNSASQNLKRPQNRLMKVSKSCLIQPPITRLSFVVYTWSITFFRGRDSHLRFLKLNLHQDSSHPSYIKSCPNRFFFFLIFPKCPLIRASNIRADDTRGLWYRKLH